MKLYVRSAMSPLEYNQSQSIVGSPLKTLKGSRIARSSKYGVGKEIGGSIYVHKNYADLVVPSTLLKSAETILHDKYPEFEYSCIKYDPKLKVIAFQESPDFDTAREPKVGDYVIVKPDGSTKTGHSDYIYHHKWLWVKNSYAGFDVADSWNWSKQWLSVLREPSDGNGIDRWINQLNRYHLPQDIQSQTKIGGIKMKRVITAANTEDQRIQGTTFYQASEEDIKRYYHDSDNCIIEYLIHSRGFEALDLDSMYGSAVIDDMLYICVTDGDYIVVGDDVEVNPEEALETYDLDDLQRYIKPITDTIIRRYVSEYEMKFPDIDDLALEMLEKDYSFTQIVKAAIELELIDM